jgi:flavin-dependent dehydrogenase
VRAVELNPTGIIHGAGVTSIKQDNGGNVRLTVRNEKLEQEQTITSRYVMCADGGRHFANEFGVGWIGQEDIFQAAVQGTYFGNEPGLLLYSLC